MSREPKTDKQRAAVHVWMGQVAEILNNAGIEQRVVIEALSNRGVDMPWTKDSFKANVYKPVYQRVNMQESTEQASTTDHNMVYMGLCRWFAQEWGVELPPWPAEENRSEAA